jgi:hypothetical protein
MPTPAIAKARTPTLEPVMKHLIDDLATGLMVVTLSLASFSMFVVVAFGAA